MRFSEYIISYIGRIAPNLKKVAAAAFGDHCDVTDPITAWQRLLISSPCAGGCSGVGKRGRFVSAKGPELVAKERLWPFRWRNSSATSKVDKRGKHFKSGHTYCEYSRLINWL